jgi:hypothetical protein
MKTPFDEYFDDMTDRDNFLLWAFPGIRLTEYENKDIPHLWNKTHANIFEMTEWGNMLYDIPHMIKLWKTYITK